MIGYQSYIAGNWLRDSVIPSQAETQIETPDSRLRGNDGMGVMTACAGMTEWSALMSDAFGRIISTAWDQDLVLGPKRL